MRKKLLIVLCFCSATTLLAGCFGDKLNQNKQIVNTKANPPISSSPSLKPSSTVKQSINPVKSSEDVKKFILDASRAVNQIKIKNQSKKIYKVGNFDMIDIELEKSKSEIDKMMSVYFAKDLIDFELFRANILYLDNKFCALASDFPSGYNISETSYFEEVAGGPYMTAVQIDTIPKSQENKSLLYSLSNETGKWIVVKEEGFKYYIDMYNQIYGKNNNNGYLAGKWVRQETGDSTIEITDVKGSEFKFSLLSVNSAGRTGDLNGVAKINGNKAYYKIDSINAELIFNLSEKQIVIEGKGNINANNGMGVTFEGKYAKK